MVDKRVFIIVLDSVGIGALPDAADYGDKGSHTLRSIARSPKFCTPHLADLGLFNIDGQQDLVHHIAPLPTASFARLAEISTGKDTTIGHWEIAGVISPTPLPTYPQGFPQELIHQYEQATGHKVLCNQPYSGTEVIHDYGREQIESGALIVYTSADSVFQVAAHETYIGLDELYRCCQIARDMLVGEHGVGRVIARPYRGEYPDFQRTKNRKDYSIPPPAPTMLDKLQDSGYATIGIGKIHDIFAGRGVGKSIPTSGNDDGMQKTIAQLDQHFQGLCFVNLVDFDMLYGHRNDVDGYAHAMSCFDQQLAVFLQQMKAEDILIITADHGCDPAFPGTDHTREYVPMLIYGDAIKPGIDLGTRASFSDISATVLDLFEIEESNGSFLAKVHK